MNFLAHLYLAEDNDASRLGNMLGDFVKGPVHDAPYPDSVKKGIREHRLIDEFCDSHPAGKEARALISPKNRRYAGIAVDVFFDHFLARDWNTFHPVPLDHFAQSVYRMLDANKDILPKRLRFILPWMQRENWLVGYSEKDGIARSIRGLSGRLARRLNRTNQFASTLSDLDQHYVAFEKHFRHIIADLERFVNDLRVQSYHSNGVENRNPL